MNSNISGHPILLVDDDEKNLSDYKQTLEKLFPNEIKTFKQGTGMMAFLEKNEAAVIVLDLLMPHVSGLDFLIEIAVKYPHLPVVAVIGNGEAGRIDECMSAGAFDYFIKGVDENRLILSIKKAIELTELQTEAASLKEYLLNDTVEHEEAFRSIITKNRQIRSIFQYIEATAPSIQPVLIVGERGTGKKLFARSIHEVSGRKGPFVSVNAAGLDDELFNQTLFGHVKGTRSGAQETGTGLIEKAAGGTLFINEINALSDSSQMKLLRLLQENTYYPAGGDEQKKSYARIIVAADNELAGVVSEDLFRKDLYYRLNSHRIDIPPLRKRTGDIPLLVLHFIKKTAILLKKNRPAPPPELFDLLSNYHFPGNVRELEAMVFNAVKKHKTGILSTRSFRQAITLERSKDSMSHPTEKDYNHIRLEISGRLLTLREAEEILINKAMEKSNNNQRLASEMLGITRQALNKRLIRKREVNS